MSSVDGFAKAVQLPTHGDYHVPQLREPDAIAPTSQRRVSKQPGQPGVLHDPVDGPWLLSKTVLGQGGLRKVVLARNARSHVWVAVKKCDKAPHTLALLQHEATLLQRLNSPLTPMAILEGPKKFYVVTPLMAQDLGIYPALSANARRGLGTLTLRHILPTLQALHAQGLAHRDIKPTNVLFRDARLLLDDLEAARPLEHADYAETTQAYAAPECLGLGAPAGQDKADLWSLACTVLELSTGVFLCPTEAQALAQFDDDAAARTAFFVQSAEAWRAIYPDALRLAAELAAQTPGTEARLLRLPELQRLHVYILSEAPAALRGIVHALKHPDPKQRPSLAWVQAHLPTADGDEARSAAALTALSKQRGAALGATT